MAVILAGGSATRFGGADKAFLPLAGQPLIAHLIERLTPQADRLVISANGDAARFATFGLPVLADETQGQGPLAGVLAALAAAGQAGATAVLSVPVDTPFIPPDLAGRLHPAPAYAQTRNTAGDPQDHPLIALWPATAAPALRLALSQDRGRVRAALAHLNARAEIFGDPQAFLNINTASALTQAQALWAAR